VLAATLTASFAPPVLADSLTPFKARRLARFRRGGPGTQPRRQPDLAQVGAGPLHKTVEHLGVRALLHRLLLLRFRRDRLFTIRVRDEAGPGYTEHHQGYHRHLHHRSPLEVG